MTEEKENKRLNLFDIVILILSIYVIFALVIDSFFHLSAEVSKLLNYIDSIICVVFLGEFLYRFIKAPSKLAFMKWGWIDLISSIPTFEYFRYGRLIRLFRILRVLRTFRSVKFISQHLFVRRKQSAFVSVSLIAIMMVIFGSISILQVEQDPNCNIKTAEDAIWWSFVTITTVGYGDKYPITTEGRVIAAFLMVTGVGLFGTFTGFIASWFMGDKKNET